jgi:asparagine synthase (glutamine-hydrolysing)
MHEYLDLMVDLTDPGANFIYNMSAEAARAIVLEGNASAVGGIEGSFALIAKSGKTVRMARSLDRPLRYFLAKRVDGPVLIVADRIDAIFNWLKEHDLHEQFHPSYTRMLPAHHVVEIQLIGCPDPDPTYTRFFAPRQDTLPSDPQAIGEAYVGALAEEIERWLRRVPDDEPLGVSFSGGVDSGAVFLVTYHLMLKLGLNPARLKAFTLDLGDGADLPQARQFLDTLGLGLFLESIEGDVSRLDMVEALRVVEDYKPLDIECASMGLQLCRGIRERYPQWTYLLDGDGGDENLKDYPIEENPELTIRSVVNNVMLYQEGWGVGRLKHSLTYSGGLSRSYTRTYAPSRHYGFVGFSPFTRPAVVDIAEGIPYRAMAGEDVERLYAIKGDVVSRGVQALTGMKMPTFPKRRFQHGAMPEESLRKHLPVREADYRRQFHELYMR